MMGLAAASVGTLSILPCRTGMGQITGSKRKQPNIIFVLTDDQGWGDLGCHGNPVVKTPNLDKFAEESVEFSQFYVSPVCSPTRASLMTGRYNYRTKVAVAGGGWSMMDT
ncbi:MAG TPA: N-acetylgalactosamine 6-sulfate sulfatase, partial [Phycisphaerales bacterium]|nr:N-acetylgalactosamine 6-sulfate sulfatase [Phycisphaerales bacterium]